MWSPPGGGGGQHHIAPDPAGLLKKLAGASFNRHRRADPLGQMVSDGAAKPGRGVLLPLLAFREVFSKLSQLIADMAFRRTRVTGGIPEGVISSFKDQSITPSPRLSPSGGEGNYGKYFLVSRLSSKSGLRRLCHKLSDHATWSSSATGHRQDLGGAELARILKRPLVDLDRSWWPKPAGPWLKSWPRAAGKSFAVWRKTWWPASVTARGRC